jgi:hypothetical protein
MNSADLEFAAEKASGDQKKALQDKSTAVKLQAVDLQKMVDDRFSGKGAIVDRKLHKAKIEGQLQLIKRTSGMEDDPNVVSSLKDKMKELADKFKEENAAIADLEDKNKDAIEAEKERIRAEAAAAKESDTTTTKDAEAQSSDATTSEPAADAEPASDAETETPEAEPAKDPKVTALEDEIANLEQELTNAENSPNKNKEGISVLQSSIAGKKKSLQTLKDKVQDSLINRANAVGLNELATEIKSKLDWQVSEGTALYIKYNEAIKKSEYANTLNENRYNDLSIKDKFSRLI